MNKTLAYLALGLGWLMAVAPAAHAHEAWADRIILILLAVFGLTYVGFALLALSQSRHWKAVTGDAPPCRLPVVVLRAVGVAMMILSLVVALLRDGPSFGSLLWATAISLAALAVAFTLAWRPGVLRPLAAAGRGFATSCRP